jgi:hypothetical protein
MSESSSKAGYVFVTKTTRTVNTDVSTQLLCPDY